ncbi:restriction endonuclease subunit S [Aerosakkonema funiforme]|uniref:restriction endonuclease subunit S n=1 Tax=Aerosakkonema funiforme TaxID=1246630 RepID=UPI0035BB3882
MGEDLYELPDGWLWAFLSEVGELNRGKSKHRPRDDARLYGGKYPFIQTGDVRNSNSVIKTYTQTYNEFGLAQSKLWDKDTLCITIAANIAETALLGIPACFPDSIVGFIAHNRICSVHYIHYFIKSIKTKLDSYAPATAQKNINLNILRIVSVPLPPLPEQYRIVAKIEELFTELDAGVELLKKLKAKLKRYRQAVLKAAVEGNLTKEWREANQGELEPASMLLERILKQRREKWEAEQLAKMKAQGKTPKDDSWKLKYKEPVAPNTSDLSELPDGWCWGTFDQASERVTVGHVGSMKNEYIESGVPFLRSQNVRENRYDPEGLKFISPEFDKKLMKSSLQPGDLVVVRSGSVGVCCVIPETLKKANCSDLVIVKQPKVIDPYFGAFYMNSIARSRVNAQQVGVALIHFNTQSMAAMPVPIPPFIEQLKIVEQVQRLLSVIDQLEKTIDFNLKRAEKLRQSILKQAFEGKLVPQDPNDEPAEKLLERIKAEKAKQTTTKTKRKTQSKTQSSIQLELPLE